ncbi:amidohydrolase [Demequina pelophila]|uniref:amidohydrolase n=1 Tax=Demequina pelophila TaxID=1638984 RepID=UPI00078223DF|nr:amidohydrolase [Demequina pelophila]
MTVTILTARLVRTMDDAVPTATAVAIRGDRILAVGTGEGLAATYPGAVVDGRYADAVLTPGFVEAHSHMGLGALLGPHYLGFFPRTAPDGAPRPGAQSFDEVLAALRAWDAELAPEEPLLAHGLDMLAHPGAALNRHVLDAVSTTRPILVVHQSLHVATANSALLEALGWHAGTDATGVVHGEDALPTGELHELVAMTPALEALGVHAFGGSTAAGMLDLAHDARNHGCTTATDLANTDLLRPGGLDTLLEVTARDDFPLRVVPATFGAPTRSAEEAAQVAALVASSQGSATSKLHLGTVKLMLDGSIQQFTARLQEPGYLGGEGPGVWSTDPDLFREQFHAFHAAGLNIHVHANGDEATELVLDAVEEALARTPRWNHRHTVTHSQLSTRAQYRRMAELGVCANIFSNHIWYWGDQHIDATVGPDRVLRMCAARTAIDAGVTIAFHCDTPVTPLDPLATASYAVERRTPTGRSWGEAEAVTVKEALEAITIGPAYQLKLDHLLGSIVPGKYADFAVLDLDPLVVAEPRELREIAVVGTVVGGAHFRAPAAGPAGPA